MVEASDERWVKLMSKALHRDHHKPGVLVVRPVEEVVEDLLLPGPELIELVDQHHRA